MILSKNSYTEAQLLLVKHVRFHKKMKDTHKGDANTWLASGMAYTEERAMLVSASRGV